MPLTSAERRSLRARAHTLKPVVQTGGQGLTEAVLAEVDIALEAHELIKLRLPGMPREDRRAAARRSAAHCKAELVGEIGSVVILYRPQPPSDKPGDKPGNKSSAGARPAGRARKPAPARPWGAGGREGGREGGGGSASGYRGREGAGPRERGGSRGGGESRGPSGGRAGGRGPGGRAPTGRGSGR